MALTKLSSTDAFVVTDGDDPEAPATGVVRTGKKILQSSAKDLARSVSYSFAAFGVQRVGASAGINAVDDAVGPATEAFVAELTDRVSGGSLQIDAGKGTDPDAIADLTAAAGRPPLAGSVEATVAGVIAAGAWANGGTLEGASVAVEGAGVVAEQLLVALDEVGATLVEVPGLDSKPWMIWGAEADLVFAGSKPGALTHQGSPFVKAKAVVPWGPIPFTTKAFAELRRAGVVMVPDFLSAAGALLPGNVDQGAGTPAEIAALVTTCLEESRHDDGVLLGACYRAEAFLATWLDAPLFGRPLAA
jgi:glutamate dehydrogenase/leucine dehydrogenase